MENSEVKKHKSKTDKYYLGLVKLKNREDWVVGAILSSTVKLQAHIATMPAHDEVKMFEIDRTTGTIDPNPI